MLIELRIFLREEGGKKKEKYLWPVSLIYWTKFKDQFSSILDFCQVYLHPVSITDHVLDVAKEEQMSVLEQTVWTPIPCIFHALSSIAHSPAALLHFRPLPSSLSPSPPLLSLPFSPFPSFHFPSLPFSLCPLSLTPSPPPFLLLPCVCTIFSFTQERHLTWGTVCIGLVYKQVSRIFSWLIIEKEKLTSLGKAPFLVRRAQSIKKVTNSLRE